MTVPALSDALAANTPPKLSKPRAKSTQKNVSERDRRERLESQKTDKSLAPTWFKEARHICELCGGRSVESLHPADPSTGLPMCQAPRLGLRSR
jgi:hypothetical protein